MSLISDSILRELFRHLGAWLANLQRAGGEHQAMLTWLAALIAAEQLQLLLTPGLANRSRSNKINDARPQS